MAENSTISAPAPASELRTRPFRRRFGIHVALGLLGTAVLGGIMLGVDDAYYESLVVSGLTLAVLAVGWNVVGGFAGQLSFGHAAFYGLGAYAAGQFVNNVGGSLVIRLIGAFVAAILVGALASLVMLAGFRAQGPYFAILTLAMAESLRLLGQNFLPGADAGVFVKPLFGPNSHGPLYLALVVGFLAVLVSALVRRSRLGLGLFAIREDVTAAAASGVPTIRVRGYGFAISAGTAGAAGALYAVTQALVDPPTVFDPSLSVLPVLIVTLGGMGTIAGPVIGATLWTIINTVLSNVSANSGYTTIVYGALLVVLAIRLPYGMYGVLVWVRGLLQRPVGTARVAGAVGE